MSAIKQKIQSEMQINGISIGALSKSSGVSKAQISRWLSGKSDLTIETLEKVAEVFGLVLELS